jgi:hypothetical protein
MAIRLNNVIPWGRSFGEYERMFDLSASDLSGPRILGCGDGPASFNAEATARGVRVVSCDPIYVLSRAQIERRVDEAYGELMDQVRAQQAGFVWTHFRDPEDLGRCRLAAMRRFLDDFDGPGRRSGRYVAAALPRLPFADRWFDLAVVSHLLFLYSEHLDLAFHWASLAELMRVAREVRIFPLLTLARTRSPHVGPVVERCRAIGWEAEVCRVGYEFQRGGNEMLRVRRAVR